MRCLNMLKNMLKQTNIKAHTDENLLAIQTIAL